MSGYRGFEKFVPKLPSHLQAPKKQKTLRALGGQPEQARRPTAPTDAQSLAPSDPLVLRLPRRLETPNVWNGRHWRTKHRISQQWADEIGWAVVAMQVQEFGARAGGPSVGLMRWASGRSIEMPVAERMRVTVERHVPSGRNFIRDDDNLRFCVKPLLDALKRQGYIKNDSRKWLEHPTPTQHVSADGKDWTVITIEAVTGIEIVEV